MKWYYIREETEDGRKGFPFCTILVMPHVDGDGTKWCLFTIATVHPKDLSSYSKSWGKELAEARMVKLTSALQAGKLPQGGAVIDMEVPADNFRAILRAIADGEQFPDRVRERARIELS